MSDEFAPPPLPPIPDAGTIEFVSSHPTDIAAGLLCAIDACFPGGLGFERKVFWVRHEGTWVPLSSSWIDAAVVGLHGTRAINRGRIYISPRKLRDIRAMIVHLLGIRQMGRSIFDSKPLRMDESKIHLIGRPPRSGGLPVLRGELSADGIQLIVWCPFCCAEHRHGFLPGHRLGIKHVSHRGAHCGPESPLKDGGYLIFTPDTAANRRILDRKLGTRESANR